MNSKKKLKTYQKILKRFLLIYLPLFTLASVVLIAFYYNYDKSVKRDMQIIETKEVDYVNMQMKIIIKEFNMIMSDLKFLSDNYQMQQLFDTSGSYEAKTLARVFSLLCDNKKIYDQARFLDEKGMEIVRANYNAGISHIVPEKQLQFKGKRYYFTDIIKLDKGDMYVSPFDLNVEYGVIEKPQKPMIRFGTLVFDKHGQKRGIVVLNYLGENLINELRMASKNALGDIMLLNSDGYWLHSFKPENEWGFMYEDRNDLTFGNADSNAWQQISVGERGHFYNKNGLFTFTTVYPLLEGLKSSSGSSRAFEPSTKNLQVKEYSWKIVSYVAIDVLSARRSSFMFILFSLFGIAVVLTGGGSWLLATTGTHRKIAEIELKESEERLQAIIDNSTAVIYLKDTQSSFIMINKRFENLFKISKNEIIGKTDYDIFPKELADDFQKNDRKVLEARNPLEFEEIAPHEDGLHTYISLKFPLSNKEGVIYGVCGISTDVTERKKTEKKIKSLAKFPSENPNPVLRIEKNGSILYTNNAGSIILDYWDAQIGQSVPEDWHKHALDVLRAGKSNNYEMKINDRIFSITLAPVVEEGYANFYGLDITERKKMEKAILQSEKLKSIGTITAGISHDFNNILAIISGNVQLLEETYKDNEELTNVLRTINKATYDGAEITSKMLAFTKTEQDTKRLVSFNIWDLLMHSIDFTKPRWKNEAQARGVDYKMDTEGKKRVLSIMCNPTEIREVFINIINNALDAMPEGGSISFSIWSGDNTVFVGISDTGEGMSEEVRKNIFDPFFSTKGVEGTGLGMSMAYGIIARHGGKIDVASEIGKGTTFTLQFPTTNKRASLIEVPEMKQETNVKSLRILVVDDKEAICYILDKFLSGSGHKVKTVNSGADAIEIIKTEDFNLILCDLAMPDVSGYDVIKALNKLEKTPKIGLITGWVEKLKQIEVGINVDFIARKPFNFPELTKQINIAFGADSK